VAFVSLIRHLNRMLYGAPPAGVTLGEDTDWRFGFLTVNLAALVVLGLALPAPVGVLLNQIVAIVGNR